MEDIEPGMKSVSILAFSIPTPVKVGFIKRYLKKHYRYYYAITLNERIDHINSYEGLMAMWEFGKHTPFVRTSPDICQIKEEQGWLQIETDHFQLKLPCPTHCDQNLSGFLSHKESNIKKVSVIHGDDVIEENYFQDMLKYRKETSP